MDVNRSPSPNNYQDISPKRRRFIPRERKERSGDRSSGRHRDHDRNRGLQKRSLSRSRSRERESLIKPKNVHIEWPYVTVADLQGKTPEEQEIMMVMGFCGFGKIKGKKVEGILSAHCYVKKNT